MEGPSPLLSSWLEFSVMPGRIVTLSGLKTGASPLLLGDAEEQQGDDGGGDEWEGRDAMLHGSENYLPAPAVLDLSEFVEPVDGKTLQIYGHALQK
jgi:hypothetical protein